jgi:hypothetical protein
LEEFDDLMAAFKRASIVWNSHARLGLEAIIALDPEKQRESSAHTSSSVSLKSRPNSSLSAPPPVAGSKKDALLRASSR